MREIRCPKCGEVFQVDESGYAAIVKQVRDKEFEKEIREREAQFRQEKQAAEELARTKRRSRRRKAAVLRRRWRIFLELPYSTAPMSGNMRSG